MLKDCTALTTVSLKCYGDHPLDLSGCTELLNLDLSGTAMQSLNIKGLTKLHMFNISDSQIAELTTSEAAGYTNAYNWNWKNAKLDLTDGTSEGALKESVKITLLRQIFRMSMVRTRPLCSKRLFMLMR